VALFCSDSWPARTDSVTDVTVEQAKGLGGEHIGLETRHSGQLMGETNARIRELHKAAVELLSSGHEKEHEAAVVVACTFFIRLPPRVANKPKRSQRVIE
jgi:hypothetical protein